MDKAASENGQSVCTDIRGRLQVLFPEMTFRVSPVDGTCMIGNDTPGTIRIFGQRTKNMRYDRGNFFASFDINGDAYDAAGEADKVSEFLQTAVADLEAQLRMHNQ